MTLFPMSEMLQTCRRRGFAVGYFESWNFESLKAVIRAAEDTESPVIVGFNGTFVEPADLKYLCAASRAIAESAKIPAALLLNEAPDIRVATRAIRYGFEAVMVDSSSLPFDENVRLTRRIVDIAHDAGVSVEAPLGELPKARSGCRVSVKGGADKTDPKMLRIFVKETGADVVAVSVGMVHELCRGTARIDFELLRRLRQCVDVPLAVHGGTGISRKDSRRLVRLGVQKFNVGTALRMAYLGAIRERMARSKGETPIETSERSMAESTVKVRQAVRERMRLYGSAGKAGLIK